MITLSTLIIILLITKLIQLNVSVDRLTVAQLKCRDVIRNGEQLNFHQSEINEIQIYCPVREFASSVGFTGPLNLSNLILNSTPAYQGLVDKILTNAPHPELQREPTTTKYEEEEEENHLLASFNLLSCLDGFCLVVGSSGEVIFASENIQKFVGLSSEEVLGQHLADFVHPCDQVAFLNYLGVNHNPFLKLTLAALVLMIASAERMLDARMKF